MAQTGTQHTRGFNEAGHKVYVPPPRRKPGVENGHESARRHLDAQNGSERDVVAHAGRAVLVLGALGVVYGDIGTSPLYTEQVIFSSYHATSHIPAAGVYG